MVENRNVRELRVERIAFKGREFGKEGEALPDALESRRFKSIHDSFPAN